MQRPASYGGECPNRSTMTRPQYGWSWWSDWHIISLTFCLSYLSWLVHIINILSHIISYFISVHFFLQFEVCEKSNPKFQSFTRYEFVRQNGDSVSWVYHCLIIIPSSTDPFTVYQLNSENIFCQPSTGISSLRFAFLRLGQFKRETLLAKSVGSSANPLAILKCNDSMTHILNDTSDIPRTGALSDNAKANNYCPRSLVPHMQTALGGRSCWREAPMPYMTHGYACVLANNSFQFSHSTGSQSVEDWRWARSIFVFANELNLLQGIPGSMTCHVAKWRWWGHARVTPASTPALFDGSHPLWSLVSSSCEQHKCGQCGWKKSGEHHPIIFNHYQILPLSIFRWCLKSSKFPRCLETYQAHPSRSRSLSERWTLQSRARRTCLWRFASADYGHQLDLCNHQGPCLWQLNDIKRHSTTFNDFGQNMISSLEWSKPAKSAWSVPKSIQCFLSSGPMDDSIVANMAADELMVAQVKSKQPVKTWVPWLQAHDPDRAQQFQLHLDHMSAFYIWTLRKNNFLTVAGSMCKDLHIRTFQSLSINTCKKRIIMSTIVHLIWGCKIMPT